MISLPKHRFRQRILSYMEHVFGQESVVGRFLSVEHFIFSNMQCFEACSISPGKSEALCEQTDARIRIDRTAGLGYLTTHYFLDDQHENTTLKKELRLYKYFPFGAPFYTRDCYKLVITDKDAIYNDNKLTPLTKQYIPLDGNNNMNKQLIMNGTMK